MLEFCIQYSRYFHSTLFTLMLLGVAHIDFYSNQEIEGFFLPQKSQLLLSFQIKLFVEN